VSLKDVLPWVTILATVLAAGMYVGRLEQRVATLERMQHFSHGDLSPWVAQR